MSIHELMSSSFCKMFHWRWATAWSFSPPRFPSKNHPNKRDLLGSQTSGTDVSVIPGNGKAQTGRPASLEDFFQERQAGLGVSVFWVAGFFRRVLFAKGKKKTCLKNGEPTKKKQILGKMEGWMEVWWCPKIFVFKSYQVESRADWIDVIYVYHTYFYLILMLNVGNCIHGSYGRPWFKWDLIFLGVIKKLFPTDGVQPEWLENSMKKTRGEH